MTLAADAVGLPPALRKRARELALEIGDRLLWQSRESPADPLDQWKPGRGLNASSGFALAFLALAQATQETRFEEAMHGQIQRAARLTGPELGLLDGISGLRAAAAAAAAIEPRYQRFVDQCDRYVEAHLPAAPHAPASFCDFDVITGWSGIRLARCLDGALPPDRCVELLAWLIDDETRWRCAHPLTGAVENDLGLAHGLPGMLAAIALTVDDLGTQLRARVGDRAWSLTRYALVSDGVPAWPNSLQTPVREWYRTAWCYGATGVASALYIVGKATGDAALETYALDVLRQLAELPVLHWMTADDAICHGSAGNALIFAGIARSSADARLGAAAHRIVDAMLERLEANGGVCLAWNKDGSERVPAYGELTGIAGTVLTLLTLTGDADTTWMRCHALLPVR